MIDHHQYRSAILADPHDPGAELRAHRDACPECRAFTEQLLSFESRLERALRLDIPSRADALPFTGNAANAGSRRTGRWMAMAASVLLGLVIVGGVWLTFPQRSLAADVVTHMAGEPDAWRTEAAVPEPALDAVLRQSNVRLKPGSGIVSYASTCDFRGHKVPHLVVQTASGPVTVMVLAHEPVRRSMRFDEQGYRGTIVAVPGHGSIAVLMRDSEAGSGEVERIATQVDDSIVWMR